MGNAMSCGSGAGVLTVEGDVSLKERRMQTRQQGVWSVVAPTRRDGSGRGRSPGVGSGAGDGVHDGGDSE